MLVLAMMAGGTVGDRRPGGHGRCAGGDGPTRPVSELWRLRPRAHRSGIGTRTRRRHRERCSPRAIEVPWCYLEFGDVGWCRSPARLDARLRAAGLRIAAAELALASCKPDPAAMLPCAGPGSEQAKALKASAGLLRDAESNGAVFLALPANGRPETRSTKKARCCGCCARVTKLRAVGARRPPKRSSAPMGERGRGSAVYC